MLWVISILKFYFRNLRLYQLKQKVLLYWSLENERGRGIDDVRKQAKEK